jgi:hypothetical protein
MLQIRSQEGENFASSLRDLDRMAAWHRWGDLDDLAPAAAALYVELGRGATLSELLTQRPRAAVGEEKSGVGI